MEIFSDNDRKILKKIFEENLKKEVEIEIYSDFDKKSEINEITKKLFEEIMEITEKIKIDFINLNKDILKEKNLMIKDGLNDSGPIITFKKYPNVIFYGLPLGEEFSVLLEDIFQISNEKYNLSKEAIEIIKGIDKEIEIYVFVTLNCPYCPVASSIAHSFSIINKKIKSFVIDSERFFDLAEKYNVYAVPKVVIIYNGNILEEWEGAVTDKEFSKKIKEAYNRINES